MSLNVSEPAPCNPWTGAAPAAELERLRAELGRSQERLLATERMAALGRVAAGIAHEINSPLAGALNSLRSARGYVDEYRTSAADPEVTPEDHLAIADDIVGALDVAEAAVAKVAQFVRSIKGQTRAGAAESLPFDPAREVDSTLLLLQHEAKRRGVGVFTDLERGHRLAGDPGQFSMVVQNLVGNAMDAYEDGPGEVWVRLRAEGERLLLRVEDRGCGIPEEIRERIFDDLFTTKQVGRGTGLGLSTVRSVVVAGYGGEISLESEVGVGTTFVLALPLTPIGTEHGA